MIKSKGYCAKQTAGKVKQKMRNKIKRTRNEPRSKETATVKVMKKVMNKRKSSDGEE